MVDSCSRQNGVLIQSLRIQNTWNSQFILFFCHLMSIKLLLHSVTAAFVSIFKSNL